MEADGSYFAQCSYVPMVVWFAAPQGTTAQFKLLAALDANLRQESQLEAGLRHVCTKVMEPVQAAKVKVTSWPFIPDYPAILEGILQDRHTIA